jgi:peroxiredoxin
MRSRTLVVLAVAVSGLLTLPALAGGPGAAPAVGQKAPAFALTSPDGEPVTLAAELARGPVVLVLLRGYPGYQCPFCTRQFGDFLAHAKDLAASGARVIWVYPGPSDQVAQRAKEFMANTTLPGNVRIATDPDYAFTLAYGLRWDAPNETAYPATFVVDRRGIVRFAQISVGHDGRARAEDVLKALAALRAGLPPDVAPETHRSSRNQRRVRPFGREDDHGGKDDRNAATSGRESGRGAPRTECGGPPAGRGANPREALEAVGTLRQRARVG